MVSFSKVYAVLHISCKLCSNPNINTHVVYTESMCNYFNQKFNHQYHQDAVLISEVMKDKNQRKSKFSQIMYFCQNQFVY